MKAFSLFLFLISANAFSSLDNITIENLDLDYNIPYGKGTVERVGIGISLQPVPFEIEINRLFDSFEVTSPFVDFTWNHPEAFIHNMESIVAKRTNADLGRKKKHTVESEYLMFRPKNRGEYIIQGLSGSCEGEMQGRFETRLLEDCRNKMDITINKIDVPTDFILYKLINDLPTTSAEETDIPGDNVIIRSRNGDYSLQIYLKYWIRAGLRSWGHIQYEDNRQTIAIRVDQVKFGYITVTGMALKKLQEMVTGPNIKVDPPWIRIKIGGLNK